MDNVTLDCPPIPKAASTRIIDNRIKNIRLSDDFNVRNFSLGSADDSSFGLIPEDLLDASNFNPKQKSATSRRSSKPPSLPSVSEFSGSPAVNGSLNESSEDEPRTAIKGECVNQVQKYSQRLSTVSISELSNIDFCDQQISARSSIADVEASNQPFEAKQHGASVTLSNLFKRSILDVSTFIPQSNNDVADSNQLKKSGIERTLERNNTQLLNDEKSVRNEFPEVSTDVSRSSDEDLNLYHELGNLPQVDFDDDVNFVSGGDCIGLLERDEAHFKSECLLMIDAKNDDKESNIKRESDENPNEISNWMDNDNVQDVTRPSWMTNNDGDGSRISIGKLFAARGASIESNIGGLLNTNKCVPPLFGSDETYKLQSVIKENTEGTINNNSAVSDFLNDVSINDDTHLVWTQAYKMMTNGNVSSFQKKPKFSKISSVTTLTPIPSASDARSPAPSEYVDRLDKSIQTSLDKTPVETTTAISIPCDYLKQSSSVSYGPITASLLSPDIVNRYGLGLSDLTGASPQQPPSSDVRSVAVDTRNDGARTTIASTSRRFSTLQSCFKVKNFDVDMPSAVDFEPCCVGVSTESTIQMHNEKFKWLEGSYKVLSVTLDGRDWTMNNINVFIVPHVWHLQPKATQYLSIVFSPPQLGCWKAQLQFYFRVIGKSDKNENVSKGSVNDWELSSVVTLRGDAESPNLTFTPREKIDFGIVTEESLSTQHFQIRSDGSAKFPLRLSIEESSCRGADYYFQSESGSATSTDVLSKVLHIGKGKESNVSIAFMAPKVSTTVAGGYFQLFSAVLRIALDISGPNPVLGSIPLCATVGAVRLCSNLENETIQLSAPANTSHTFSLHNQGGIPLSLELAVNHPEQISVVPNELMLLPGSETNLQVLLNHVDRENKDSTFSVLEVKICPGGLIFEIPVVVLPFHVQPEYLLQNPDDKHKICSDRRAITWGTVGLGQEMLEKLTLRNTSRSATLHLNIAIKLDPDNAEEYAFYLIEPTGLKIKTVLTLPPLQQAVIQLLFKPTSRKCYNASLVVKPQQPYEHSNFIGAWLKYTIPLSGNGGVSLVRLLGLKKELQSASEGESRPSSGHRVLETNYSICVNESKSCFQIVVRNDGDRAALIKIVSSSDGNSIVPMQESVSVKIQPSCFLLQSGTHTAVTVFAAASGHFQMKDFYLLLGSVDDVLWRRCMLLLQNGLVSPDSEEHFMKPILFDSRVSLQPCAEGTFETMHLPSMGDYSRLSATIKLHRVKVQFVNYEEQSGTRDQDNFVMLPPEMTFSEATYLEPTSNDRGAVASLYSKDDSMVPTIDSCIRVAPTTLVFPETKVNESSICKLKLKNLGNRDYSVSISKPEEPFNVKTNSVVAKAKHYISIPVFFHPIKNGVFKANLRIQSNEEKNLPSFLIQLQGNSV